MAADLAEAQLLQEVKSRDNVFVRFYKSKASEFYILKFVLGGIFGAGMGYGKFSCDKFLSYAWVGWFF